MLVTRFPLAIVCCYTTLLAVGFADEIQSASHTAPVRLPKPMAAATVRFAQQPARVGDRVAQQVDLELHLDTSIIQSGQVAAREPTSMAHRQQRLVEIVAVDEGKVRRARVTFAHSRHRSPENEHPEEDVVQPIEGKTYLLTRQGEQLLVTDLQGTIPPREEFEIVFNSMQSLGKPNPLAQFLLERTIRVGQTLELPQEIAGQMLGFGNELGQVEKFELQLKELSTFDGAPCAVFAASIAIAGGVGGPMQIDVTGPVMILTETCRTVVTDLTGPLSFDTLRQTSQGNFRYEATGTMRAAVRARYANSTQ